MIKTAALLITTKPILVSVTMRDRVQQMAWSEEYLENLLFRSDFASVQEAS
jgi:hypothetical protein